MGSREHREPDILWEPAAKSEKIQGRRTGFLFSDIHQRVTDTAFLHKSCMQLEGLVPVRNRGIFFELSPDKSSIGIDFHFSTHDRLSEILGPVSAG
ncbi:MAG TPA: hypothetical protein VL199_11185, partial [Burkholderiales bacterium]|nr:hypothetical protein [Burkholderiales bacterium]